MAIDHRQVHFRTSDTEEVVVEISEIADRANGKEWITISPWVDPEHVPVVSMLRRIFSARGSRVPEVTWVPAHRSEPAQLGILHSRGANAHEWIVESGGQVPESWVILSDHSKRGLLFAVHPDSPPDQVLEFAVDAARLLADVPTDDRWIAQVSSSV